MKTKTLIGAILLVVFSIFAIGSFAQRTSAQTDANNATSTAAMSGAMGQSRMMNGSSMHGRMMNGSMMSDRMMYGRGMMGRRMMGNYSSMRNLMNRLASDLSAARGKTSSATIRSDLADADSLVSKLCGELSNSWGMMMRYMPMNGNSYCYWNQSQPSQK